MPSFLAGQRLAASHLNALTTIHGDVAGGPTSGTTPLSVGSLVIPAAPLDRIVAPSGQFRVSIDTSGAIYSLEIRRDNADGTRYGYTRAERSGGSVVPASINAKTFMLPAGQTAVLVAVITRVLGDGTATVQAATEGSHLIASLSATP